MSTKRLYCLFLILLGLPVLARADYLLIPMDLAQNNHLKAYGVAFWTLEREVPVEWLLNYRAGSFLVNYHDLIAREAQIRGVTAQRISAADAASIYAEIDAGNMDVVLLEKAPRIAVYTPPDTPPWDDAVTLVLEYAEIDYEPLFNQEVLRGDLSQYDWLHLHHEDFTGQFGKFYASFSQQPWYREHVAFYEAEAARLGYDKVSEMKKAVAQEIRAYVERGGFLFAMCSATETLDIALAAGDVDIVHQLFDGDPADPQAQEKLDFSRSMAFENFTLETNPLVYSYSDIDTTPQRMTDIRSPEAHAFTLFEFSAKHDPVPTMLTQNHINIVNGFMGQTTGFNRHVIKDAVVILGEVEGGDEVKYIHGQVGQGTFTFYGGHDPEDFMHMVGDPPTNLALYPNSPGYRLILNNILFPAAEKQERKT